MHFNFTIEGNLGSDPELRYLDNGTPVAQFTLGHTNRYQRDGRWVEGGTVWITVSCWRALAERVAESLSKGDTVVVELNSDLRAESYNGRGFLRATARSVSLSMRFAGATSDRAPRTPGSPGSTGVQEVPASGGYDTGYQPTDIPGATQATAEATAEDAAPGKANTSRQAGASTKTRRASGSRREPVNA